MTHVPVTAEDLDRLLDDLVNAQAAIEAAGNALLSYRHCYPKALMVESHTRTMEGRHGLIDYCVRHAIDHVSALIRLQEQADRDEADDGTDEFGNSPLVQAGMVAQHGDPGESQHDPDRAPTAD